MNFKELADLLGVSTQTIRRAFATLYPSQVQNGVETLMTLTQSKAVVASLRVKASDRITVSEPLQNVKLPELNNPHEMIRLHRQALDMIETMIPKVETYNAICESTNLKSVAQVAQIIGSGQKRLFQFMRDNDILNQYNRPYQQHIDAGRLVVRDTVRLINNNAMTFPQVFFTGKGEIWIAEMVNGRQRLLPQ